MSDPSQQAGGPPGQQEWYDTNQALWDLEFDYFHTEPQVWDESGTYLVHPASESRLRCMRRRKPVPDAPTSGLRGD
jgi:hypothetical protein